MIMQIWHSSYILSVVFAENIRDVLRRYHIVFFQNASIRQKRRLFEKSGIAYVSSKITEEL
jgi:hypothetical protein